MVNRRIIIRTTSGLSFVGTRCDEAIVSGNGFLIQTNPQLHQKIWIPDEEVECIIDRNIFYSAEKYKELR